MIQVMACHLGQRQAIILTNAVMLLIGTLKANFSEILIEIHIFSFKKMHFKMYGKWRPFCPGPIVLSETSSAKHCEKLAKNTPPHEVSNCFHHVLHVHVFKDKFLIIAMCL